MSPVAFPNSSPPFQNPPIPQQTVQFVRPRHQQHHHHSYHTDPYFHHNAPLASTMSQQLPTPPQPLGIFANYLAHQSESLVLQERVLSLSGDSFSIKTLDGRDILQVKGEAMSLSGRKLMLDMQGRHMFTIRKEHFSFPKTYYAEDGQGKRFFEVEGKLGLGSSKAVGRFVNAFTNQPEELLMKGNFFDTYADITNSKTGQPVARIDRKLLNGRELFASQQTYVVTVSQGVDMALMVAMCICLDERRNEK